MAREDIPRVISAKAIPYINGGPPQYFIVTITKHQFNKLVSWTDDILRFWEDSTNSRYMWVRIQAKDELEAIMRFRKLWVGLPKKEQDQ